MMNQRRLYVQNKINCQAGALAVDFIFAFTLIFGFTLILFSFALTLTAVEMTQYLTFTSARAYFGAHLTKDKQSELAEKKWDQLLASDGYVFLNKSSWFDMGSSRFIGNVAEGPVTELKGYAPKGGDPNRFEGVAVQLIARILSMSSPFFGSTEPSGDGSGTTFSTWIGSYIGREPTTEECKTFLEDRYDAVMDLKVKGGGASYSQAKGYQNYDVVVIMDNGC